MRYLLAFAFACCCSAVLAAEPRWELGVAVGAVSLPDYRGSDERQEFVLPWPYVVYRSERLNVDREGVRGKLYESDGGQVQLVLSLGVSPPVDSNENAARRGMASLDPTLEVGPSVEVRLWRNRTRDLWLNLPVRAIIATDLSHSEYAGWLFAPHLEWKQFSQDGRGRLALSLGPVFASEHYHDYYYTVAPAFVLPDRPAYDASGGYSGTRLSASLSRRSGNWWLGAYARFESLTGARFIDSPLVKEDTSWVIGTGVAYVFAKSRSLVSGGP